jgi:hypothetical protein
MSQLSKIKGRVLGILLELDLLEQDLNRFKFQLSISKENLVIFIDNINYLKLEGRVISLETYKGLKIDLKKTERKIRELEVAVQRFKRAIENSKRDLKLELQKKRNLKTNILEFKKK